MITVRFGPLKKTIFLGIVTVAAAVALVFPKNIRAVEARQPCTAGSTSSHCLEKKLEATASPSTAASTVWGYSNRTMSSFNALTGDILKYINRTLPGFRSVVSDILSYFTPAVDNAKAETTSPLPDSPEKELVNKPVSQSSFDEESSVGLDEKIQSSFDTLDALYLHRQFVNSKISLIRSKWDTLSDTDITRELDKIDKILGTENDGSSVESIFGSIAWLRNTWQWPELDDVYSKTQALKKAVTAIQAPAKDEDEHVADEGEMEPIAAYATTLDNLIGDNTQSGGQETVYGKLTGVKNLAQSLTKSSEEIDALLTPDAVKKSSDLQNQVDSMIHAVLSMNKIPDAEDILQTSKDREKISEENRVINELLSLKGLLRANMLLLANGSKSALTNTWLEIGSVVFKSLLTNPSSSKSQVPVKYYLPSEIQREDIIKTDEGLSVVADTEKNQLYVEGTLTVGPNESKSVEVRVQDKWKFSKELVDDLRQQAAELSQPLEMTPFFAQGVTFKNDIYASIDKMLTITQAAVTPDQKIKAYHEARIEFVAAQDKLDKLKDLTTQTNSAGLVLGASTVPTWTIWALLIIMSIGFASMLFYMRFFIRRQLAVMVQSASVEIKNKPHEKSNARNVSFPVFLFLIFGVFNAVISGVTVFWTMNRTNSAQMTLNQYQTAATTKEEKTSGETKTPEDANGPEIVNAAEVVKTPEETVAKLKESTNLPDVEVLTIVAPQGFTKVNLREHPSTKAPVVYELANREPVVKLEEVGQWVHIALVSASEQIIEGWVHEDYVEQPVAAAQGLLSDTSIKH